MQKYRRRGVAKSLSSRLNLVALVAALIGFMFPLTQMSPERFVLGTESLAAGAGSSLSAVVPANPYNTLAQQLHDKEQALNEREAALHVREESRPFSWGETLGFISFAFSLMLCVLVGLNFYFDWRRVRRMGIFPNKFSVDLR